MSALEEARKACEELAEIATAPVNEARDAALDANALATLAVAEELRALREGVRDALLEALGDGSHLDRVGQRIADASVELSSIADRLGGTR